MSLSQRIHRDNLPRPSLDLEAIKRDNPLPSIIGAVVKLRRAGNEWKACCPFHSDRTPSFTIYKGGERFCCFGCGAQGDVFDFIQRLHGVDLVETARMLGAGDLPTVDVAPSRGRHDDDSDRTAEALAIWNAARPAQGTLADTYLRWRGLDLAIPESLRFASLRYGARGREYPVLVAAVVDVDDRICGIQRTYLADDGRGKADVSKAKLSLGRVRCGAVRMAPVSSDLIVCEGIEDALTLQQELRASVWAAAGASMLPSMRFPAWVERVTVGGDNDDAGREAVRKAAEAFALRGVEVRTMFPISGAKDFNDELRGCRT